MGATIAFTTNRAQTSTWIINPVPLAAFVGALAAVIITYVVGTQMLDDTLNEKYITKKGELLKKVGVDYKYNRDAVHLENT